MITMIRERNKFEALEEDIEMEFDFTFRNNMRQDRSKLLVVVEKTMNETTAFRIDNLTQRKNS